MSKRNIGVMFDIESLDTGPRSVVTQIAFVAFDLSDPEIPLREVSEYLPIQPQIALNRTVSADTIIWWMQQDDRARARFKENAGNDMDELLALVRSVTRKFEQTITDDCAGYELWARGPQFDLVNIESLIMDCGEAAPWKYSSVNDLRTLMRLAGIDTKDVESKPSYVKHVALDDCRYQIDCYVEAIRRLRAAS